MGKTIFVSLYDYYYTLKKSWKWIVFAALLGAVGLWSLKLIRPISYTAEGIFKSAASNETSLLSKGLNLFADAKPEKYTPSLDAKIFMLSVPCLKNAVSNMALQGYLHLGPASGFLEKIFRNAKIESLYQNLKRFPFPSAIADSSIPIAGKLPFHDYECPLLLKKADYHGSVGTFLSIQCLNDSRFKVWDVSGKFLGEGNFNKPFSWDLGTLILETNGPTPKTKVTLSLIPLKAAIHALEKRVVVTKDKQNASLLNISCTHSNRKLAASLVNGVMKGYQDFIFQEGQDKIEKQLSYLSLKQQELWTRFEKLLTKEKEGMLGNLGEGHFFSLSSELKHLTENQAVCQKNLLELSSQLTRIAAIPKEGFPQLIAALKEEKKSKSCYDSETLSSKEVMKLLNQEQLELEQTELREKKYLSCLRLLQDSTLPLSSYESILEEKSLEIFFQSIREIEFELSQNASWTPKEKERKKEELEFRKDYLKTQLLHLKDGSIVSQQTLKEKIEPIKQLCLHLLFSEYISEKNKLAFISDQWASFANSWLIEKKVEIDTSWQKAVLESVSKLIEAKNMAFHLESIDGYPILFAEPPILPNPPKLAKALVSGGFLGGFFSLVALFFSTFFKGASASIPNLRALRKKAIGVFTSPLYSELKDLPLEDFKTLSLLSAELSKKELPSSLILCSSFKENHYLHALIEMIQLRNEDILWINFKEEVENGEISFEFSSDSRFDLVTIKHFTKEKSLWLLSQEFLIHLANWKKQYRWIFLDLNLEATHPLLPLLSSKANHFIYQITQENLDELRSLPSSTLFLACQVPATMLHLKNLTSVIDRLKKRVEKAYVWLKKQAYSDTRDR